MATEGHTATVRSEVFETRIALSFFGGVSLAVYESGTAVEFFDSSPVMASTKSSTTK
jgi:hypothetical protein